MPRARERHIGTSSIIGFQDFLNFFIKKYKYFYYLRPKLEIQQNTVLNATMRQFTRPFSLVLSPAFSSLQSRSLSTYISERRISLIPK